MHSSHNLLQRGAKSPVDFQFQAIKKLIEQLCDQKTNNLKQ